MLPEAHEQIKKSVILCLQVNALLFLLLGMFLNIWWENGHHESPRYYGLWTKANCHKDICRISTGETSGYIMFVQIISVSAVVLCFTSLVVFGLHIYKEKKILSYMSGGFSAVSGFTCMLIGIVLLAFYRKLSDAWERAVLRGNGIPVEVLRYQPVPLYFFFMSGFLSIVAFGFTIANVNSKKLLEPPTYKRLGSRLTPQSLHEV